VRVFGTPGANVVATATNKFAAKDIEAALVGEKKTAEIIERALRHNDIDVFHSLKVPGWKSGDIDHAWVTGQKVNIADSKQWPGGVYWSKGEKVYRNFTRYTFAEKKTMMSIAKTLHANKYGVGEVLVVVHTAGPTLLLLTHLEGVTFVTPKMFRKIVKNTRRKSDPAVSARLMKLVAE
jgi:hypothetical protein